MSACLWAILAACGDKSPGDSTTDPGTGGIGAVGGTGNTGGTGLTGGTDGCSYQLVADGLPATLFTISATSTRDVYTAGARDAYGPLFYHFDGTGWTRIDTSSLDFDLWWLFNDGAGTMWAGGEHGRIARYDLGNGTWTSEEVGNPAYIFFGIWGSSPTNIWATAGDASLDLPGVIYHFDGTSWAVAATTSPTALGTPRGAFKVWGRGATDVYVVGTGALSMHYDGTTWTDQDSPLFDGLTLFTVAGDANETIAVGGQGNAAAQTWSVDASTLADITPPPVDIVPGFVGVYDHPLYDAAASSASGSVWRYSGGAWGVDPCTPVTSRGLHAVWVDDDNGVWSVGGDLTTLDYGVMVYSGELTVPPIP